MPLSAMPIEASDDRLADQRADPLRVFRAKFGYLLRGKSRQRVEKEFLVLNNIDPGL